MKPATQATDSSPFILPEAVVFDMDGVLFDTEALYMEAVRNVGQDFGYLISESMNSALVGLSWAGTRQLFIDSFGPDFPLETFITAWLKRFEMLCTTDLRLKPGVRDLILTLDQLAIPKAIATGAHLANVRQHLAAHSLTRSFNFVVTHEDCQRGKPAPDLFLKAAEGLGVAPERCLAIEDSPNGIRAAAAAGMPVIMVPDLVQPNNDILALCLCIVKDLTEIEKMIKASKG